MSEKETITVIDENGQEVEIDLAAFRDAEAEAAPKPARDWAPKYKPRKTASAPQRRCHRCHGSGRAPCTICNGKGQSVKGRNLEGLPIFGQCEGCVGLKTSRCTSCGGERFL